MLFVAFLLAVVYFIVFCRLMIHAHHEQGSRAGLAVVLSLPRRGGLDTRGLRYWRLYWLGWAAMLLMLGAGFLARYPAIRAGLSGS